ncbi:LacI family DNA-binding transcriptional regulator [Helcobacillus massiliensis]|uniref:LacI family DNA-binding transcriptional regulator n=1 Tax=Helcobacillus massiliensis TaxID=521392 RepID=UPI003D730663
MSLTKVAQKAGVSVSTVSRYVRGELQVQPGTARRIDAAIHEVGLKRNRRRLSSVLLVLPELSNPYFAHLAQTIAEAATRRSLRVLIAVSGGSPQREEEIVGRATASTEVDSAIFVSMSGDHAVLETVPAHFPLVVLDESLASVRGESWSYVGADHYGGAYQAVQYLLSKGHTLIAHVGGPAALASARERHRGYVDALTDRGIEPRADLFRAGPYSEAFGAASLPVFMRMKERPTAVFCASDIAAIGLLAASRSSEVHIPTDLSVIGFDGIPVGAWTSPQLATVVQPYLELAHEALDSIEHRWRGETKRSVSLPMVVSAGESVRAISTVADR